MKPPKRRRVGSQKEEISMQGRWTARELSQLLTALKNTPHEDIDTIKSHIPTRSRDQVRLELQRLKLASKYNLGAGAKKEDLRPDAPIVVWMKLAQELVHGDVDLSLRLERVMSVMSTCEPHQFPVHMRFPDYGRIYGYLAALFSQKPLPQLPRLEAAVILSILQGMAHEFSSLDSTNQRRLMQRKLALLVQKTDNSTKGRTVSWEVRRRALIEDPNLLGTASVSQPTSSSGNIASGSGQSATGSSVGAGRSSESHSHMNQSESTTSVTTSQSTSGKDSGNQSGAGQMATSSSSQSAGPVDSASQSAADESLAASQSASTMDSTSSSGQSTTTLDNASQSQPKSSASVPSSSSVAPSNVTDAPQAAAKRIIQPLPKKSSMFSLNPFCIPVKYLHMTKIKKEPMQPVPSKPTEPPKENPQHT